MKVISYNVNGIRAAQNKGFVNWLEASKPDIICLQEVKALPEQVDLTEIERLGYYINWCAAEKKGYSGVAILSLIKPDKIVKGIDHDLFDAEGRTLRADFGDISVFSIYLPSGTTGDIRQEVKYQFLDHFYDFAHKLIKERPNLIFSGDFNIAHLDIDIHNPTKQQNTSGFLPEERAWVSKFLESGFIDSFRYFNNESKQYSWWSYRAGARKKNLGWRIDYHLVSKSLEARLKRAAILPDAVHSDHCPVLVELDA